MPFLVAGPGIPAGKESDVMVNGLDFYPTFLSLAGVKKPEGKNLDGANLQPLLTGALDDASLVLDQNGKPRTDADGVIRSIPWVLMSTDGKNTQIGGSGVVEFPDASPQDPGFVKLEKDDKGRWAISEKLAQQWLEAGIDPEVREAAKQWGADADQVHVRL